MEVEKLLSRKEHESEIWNLERHYVSQFVVF